ncbi:hypothetical protein [Streptomyces sp. NPDC048419]|uniref:hypothetical protein n=1 Tax=Streptomyces sp. NPDC048419 TaxID=3365547 RepID=UPI0037235B0B
MAGFAADAEVDDAPSSAGSAGAASDAVRWTAGGVEADRAVGWPAAGLEPPGAGCAPAVRSEGEPGCGEVALGVTTG